MSSSTSSDDGEIAARIGATPLVDVHGLVDDDGPRLLIKHEGYNPGGSIRDRTVLEILNNASSSGLLQGGDEVVLAGATNSAISAAMLGKARGYKVVVFHPTGQGQHLYEQLGSLGARLETSPPEEGMTGAVMAAVMYTEEKAGRIYIDAGRRQALTDAIHAIALELLDALGGQPLGAFVTSISTGATLRHVAHQLRQHSPGLLVSGVRIAAPAKRRSLYNDTPLKHHWAGMEGLDAEEIVVTEVDAWRMRRRAQERSALELGPKGAAALMGALRLRKRVPADHAIVVLSIDGGQRYTHAMPSEVAAALEHEDPWSGAF